MFEPWNTLMSTAIGHPASATWRVSEGVCYLSAAPTHVRSFYHLLQWHQTFWSIGESPRRRAALHRVWFSFRRTYWGPLLSVIRLGCQASTCIAISVWNCLSCKNIVRVLTFGSIITWKIFCGSVSHLLDVLMTVAKKAARRESNPKTPGGLFVCQ